MKDLNIAYLDLYKSVDRFIRDAYGTDEGVSEYLRQMEQNEYKGRLYVPTWKSDHDTLMHLRWLRNQLSHEVGFDSDMCEESDYGSLKSFHSRLYSSNDPMSALRRAEQQRKTDDQRHQSNARQSQKAPHVYVYQAPPYTPPEPKTLWQRIKDFFRGK